MKKNTILITAITSLGMIGATNAAIIFNATTANSTKFFGGINGDATNTSLSGATPDLLLNSTGGDFYVAGFAGNSSVNTLNSAALTTSDTLTMTTVVDAITHANGNELRSRGYELGFATDTSITGGSPTGGDNFVLRVGGAGNGGVMSLQQSFGTITSSVFRPTEASVNDGFSVTLVANQAGFTFSFTGLIAQSGTLGDFSGTFAPGEFASLGGLRYFTSYQTRDANGATGGAGTTSADFNTVSIDVVPEPSSAALLGLGGLALILRRRKH